MGFVLTSARIGSTNGKPHPVDMCSFSPQINPVPEGSPRVHSPYSPRRIRAYSPSKRTAIPRAVALDKLVLRRGKDLDSEKVGNLLMGATVLVLETSTLEDGTVRSKVAKALRATVEPLGWVTSVKFDLTGDEEQKLAEVEAEHDELATGSSPSRADSMASRIAQRRLQHSHRGGTSQFSLHLPNNAFTLDAHLPMAPKVNDYGAVVAKMRWDADPASKPPPPPPPPPAEGWLGAAALRARAEAHRVEAVAVEARMYDSVEERLGFVLMHNTRSEEDLIKAYGTGKGKQQTSAAGMSKDGFRKMVRSIGGENPVTAGMASLLQDKEAIPDSEIDEVFDAFNGERVGGNGGADLEPSELSSGFAKLVGVVKRKRFVDAAARAAALRKAAKAHDDAASAVLAHEAEEATLEKMRKGTVASRMGDLLFAQNINVNDLKHKWDTDGSGKLQSAEFVQHALAMGLEATQAEAASLFGQLDKDKSGSLIHRELVAALTKLQTDARNKAAADAAQLAVKTKAQKASEQAQLKARAMKMVS